jgi:hypothetical protein
VILAKRRDAESNFQTVLEADPTLATEYGGLAARMAEIQADKRAVASGYGAFLGLESPEYGSAPLVRARIRSRSSGPSCWVSPSSRTIFRRSSSRRV